MGPNTPRVIKHLKSAEGGALLTQLSDEGFENLKPDISLALALELAFWM